MRCAELDKLAHVIVHYSARVKRADLVTIVADPACLPAVDAIYQAVLAAGGHPSFHAKSDRLQQTMLTRGSEAQWTHVCPFEAFRLERCDALIVLQHPITSPATAPAERLAQMQAARRGLMSMSMKRAAEGQMKYVLAEIPSAAAAQRAGMPLELYARMVYAASFLDALDPLHALEQERARQELLLRQLTGCEQLRFRQGKFTDLTVEVGQSTWINAAGEQNLPDGELFAGPAGADGVVMFNLPASYRGLRMDDVRLEFKAGRVVNASASTNENALIRLLDMDPGARGIGEIAIGTNRRLTHFTNNPFLDEKIAGTFHLALGAGYPESGNTNQSGLHWDLVCDLRQGGEIVADGNKIDAA